MDTFKDLYLFVDAAERNRKYPPNTADGKRAALRVFEPHLTQEELNSLDLVQERVDAIFRQVAEGTKNEYSAASLATYRARLLNTIRDYEEYGIDPLRMAQWNRKIRTFSKQPQVIHRKDGKKDESQSFSSIDPHIPVDNADPSIHSPVHKLDIALANGRRCIITLPADMDDQDAKTIARIIISFAPVLNKDTEGNIDK